MTETVSETVALSSASHRHDYDDVASRDRWTVRAVNAWARDTLPPLVAAGAGSGAVLDVGCGEQPFRPINSNSYASNGGVRRAA